MSLSDPYHRPKVQADTLVFNIDAKRDGMGFHLVVQCSLCGAVGRIGHNRLGSLPGWLEDHYDVCEG